MTTEKKFLLSRNGYTLFNNNGATNQRWFIYYYKDFGGFRKRVKLYGGINRLHTPEGRYKAAIKFLSDIENGAYQESSKFEAVRLQAVFKKYTAERCKTLRPKTAATYQSKVDTFLTWCAAKKLDGLDRITKPVAVAFLDSIKRNATTVNSYRDTLKMFFADFITAKLIEVNPFDNIKKLPESRRGKFPFNTDQVKQLKGIIAHENPVLWMACQLEYYCFIRPGESRLLKLEYINLADHFIIIPADISKNKKTQTVSIPAAFEPVLRAWLDGMAAQNFYILNRSARALDKNRCNRWHKAILKRLGYSSRYSLYSWKHTGAVMAVRGGISLKSLQMQMRHHSLDQLNEYLREMGVMDSVDIRNNFPVL